MKKLLIPLLLLTIKSYSQELYVFSEPASNMPARSLSVKQSGKLLRLPGDASVRSRHTTELMFGVTKNFMLHAIATMSDMYSSGQRFESGRVYGKYRLLSNDELYRHFRMAAFGELSFSRNKVGFDEISIEGDQGGVQAGVIATQLLHKLALSGTVGVVSAFNSTQVSDFTGRVPPSRAFNYSLSAGYLVLPKDYVDYKQVNLNLYLEMLGQQSFGAAKHYIDLAPAAQLIFNSQAKLNVGYRFQVDGNMNRMANNSWLISFEWLFLNVLRKR